MAAILAGDVTYSLSKSKKLDDNRLIVQATITFGDGVKTYPTGGVPLTLSGLGFGVFADSFLVDDSGKSAYQVSYDKTNKKLVMFQNDAAADTLVEIANSVAPAAQTFKVTAIGR